MSGRSFPLFFAALTVLLVPLSWAQSFHIRPHLNNISKDGVTIIWETPEASAGAVEYGADETLGQKAEDTESRAIHRVRINGLQPETVYHYRVTAGSDVLNSTFKTAPATDRPITFVLIGDSRRWEDRWEETKMEEHAAQWNPEFYLTMGDLVLKGHERELWPRHFQRFGNIIDKTWMVTARGNHEGSQIVDTENDWFASYHELPAPGEPYAALEWGNTWIALISFEATAASPKWLNEVLPSVDKKYKILAHHFPVYCSGYLSPNDERKEIGETTYKPLADVIDKYNVDLDLSGHTHIYERSFPIEGGKRNDATGATYVVNGGDINGQYPEWFAAVQDDPEAMAKPTYTVFHMGEDQIWFRTFCWGKQENQVIEIDHKIIPQNDSVAKDALTKLTSAQGQERLDTIEALGAMGAHEAAESLLTYLKHEDQQVRETAAAALRRIGIAEVSPQLAAYLQDENLKVRREVARALEIAVQPEALPQIVAAVTDAQQDDQVRESLIGALQAYAPKAETTKTLLALLQESGTPEGVRQRASYALTRTAVASDAPAIAELFKKEESEYVTLRLAFTLNVLSGKKLPVSEKAPIGQSKPGDGRQEFIDQWLGAEQKKAA